MEKEIPQRRLFVLRWVTRSRHAHTLMDAEDYQTNVAFSETQKLGNSETGNWETRKLGNSKLETRKLGFVERFCTGRRQFRVFCLIRLSVKTGGRLLDSKAVGSHSSHCHSHPPPLIIHLRDWSHPCVAVNHDDVMEREIRQGERTPPAQKEQLAVYHSKFLYHSMNPAMLQSDEASTGK